MFSFSFFFIFRCIQFILFIILLLIRRPYTDIHIKRTEAVSRRNKYKQTNERKKNVLSTSGTEIFRCNFKRVEKITTTIQKLKKSHKITASVAVRASLTISLSHKRIANLTAKITKPTKKLKLKGKNLKQLKTKNAREAQTKLGKCIIFVGIHNKTLLFYGS